MLIFPVEKDLVMEPVVRNSQVCFSFLLAFSLLLSAKTALSQEIHDPWENMNRGIFAFNDFVDVNFLEPVAQGYDAVMPTVVQTSVGNFFKNLRFPGRLISSVLQFKFQQAAEQSGRFMINSTVGIAGLIDVAEKLGIEDHYEDIGLTLGYHGVPNGPYFVIPFLGPSTVRDTFGRAVDFALDPLTWLFFIDDVPQRVKNSVGYGLIALEVAQTRADLIEAVESAKESSVDYYLFTQSAYYQYREGLIYDGEPPDEEFEDDFEDENEEEVDEQEDEEEVILEMSPDGKKVK